MNTDEIIKLKEEIAKLMEDSKIIDKLEKENLELKNEIKELKFNNLSIQKNFEQSKQIKNFDEYDEQYDNISLDNTSNDLDNMTDDLDEITDDLDDLVINDHIYKRIGENSNLCDDLLYDKKIILNGFISFCFREKQPLFEYVNNNIIDNMHHILNYIYNYKNDVYKKYNHTDLLDIEFYIVNYISCSIEMLKEAYYNKNYDDLKKYYPNISI